LSFNLPPRNRKERYAMGDTSQATNKNHITTDDLAFSAYLRMLSYRLVGSHRNDGKLTFAFDIKEMREKALRMEFVNSEFLTYYNELRNLKKLL
jgi:hypothetical protein